jgi:hypothetical protein
MGTDDYKKGISNEIYNKYRILFAKAFEKIKVIQTKNNEGCIFYNVPDGDGGALHSEPKINEPRLFISILPSSKENIEELKNRWGAK